MNTKAIIVIAWFLSSQVYAQVHRHDSVLMCSELFHENFQVFTDRNMYAVNEKIQFRAFNLSDPALKESGWSKVLYLELINRENSPVAQAKFPLTSRGTQGELSIPQQAGSGIYYLRAYTRWMRNYSPSYYFHYPIYIINPEEQHLPAVLFSQDGLGQTRRNTDQVIRNAIQLETGKDHYLKREVGMVQISLERQNLISSEGYCLSIIRQGTIDTLNYGINKNAGFHAADSIYYCPETNGPTLTGRLTYSRDHSPASSGRMHLTLMGETRELSSTDMAPDGTFIFSLPPAEGDFSYVLTPEANSDQAMEILVDNDFSSEFVEWSTIMEGLGKLQVESLVQIMIGMQVNQSFQEYPDTALTGTTDDGGNTNFYGIAAHRVVIDDFVRLPTLEEFIYEIIPEIVQYKKAGRSNFRLVGDDPVLRVTRPLILIDHVPVMDIENILRLSPQRFRYIDVINASYVRGSVQYGGIIHFISRNRDRAGLDLPVSASTGSFKAYASKNMAGSEGIQPIPKNERIPDYRNCLLWIPDFNVQPDQKVSLNFQTPDTPGNYTILVRGISYAGDILEGQAIFSVR